MAVRISRRTFLASGSVALGTWPVACAVSRPSRTDTAFRHGVASGDPGGDGVVLWTRVTTMADGVDVSWVVAADAGLRRVVARGTVQTGRARDHTVKVEVSGLEAGTTYYYAFEAPGGRSPIGRTRTLPARDAGHVRLAVASCANLPAGYFTAYSHIAARDDLDAVLHLGDYIYEYENGRFGDGTWIDRLPVPAHEAVTLDDYRARHAQYKADPDLQAVHRQHPFIAVWDDHDFANDAWQGGAENHDEREGTWEDRRRAAMQAYFEWMPVREGLRTAPSRLCRTFRFGALADLVMLDTRMAGRDRQAPARDAIAEIEAPERRLISCAEEEWLAGQLISSRDAGVSWQLIGQQVMFAPQTPPGQPTPALDSWDGYRAARERVFDVFDAVRPPNLVMLTGDAHSSWAYDLARRPFDAYDPETGRGAVGVEIVGTSITSPTGLGAGEDGERQIAAILEARPHLQYLEPRYRGYVVIDLTRERLQADWYVVPRVDMPGAGERFDRGLVTEAGRPHLVAAGTPARPRHGAADPAPA